VILYFDTSALLKLYIDEPHSGEIRELYAQAALVERLGMAVLPAAAS